jgi:uncharacterized SAM-binding protein YcdF (DUF218 family)
VLLGIWALLTKKPKRRKNLLIAIVLAAFLGSNKVLVNEMALFWEPNKLENTKTRPRIGIVLGGFAEYDVSRKRVQLSDAAERLFGAFKLLQKRTIDTLLISGGTFSISGKKIPESVYVKQYLIEMGINPGRIWIDSASKNTYENAIESGKILKNHNWSQPVYLITSALHMRRAFKTFQKADIQVVAYPVHFVSKPERGYTLADWLIPSTEALLNFDAIVKEWVGYSVYRINGKA